MSTSPISAGGSSPLAFAQQFLNPQLESANQLIQTTTAGLGKSGGGGGDSGNGLISGLTHGIPLVGGLTDGLHKIVSSIPLVGGLLGGLF